nr:hypothetical protein CFP56_37375 [Quercus suber]
MRIRRMFQQHLLFCHPTGQTGRYTRVVMVCRGPSDRASDHCTFRTKALLHRYDAAIAKALWLDDYGIFYHPAEHVSLRQSVAEALPEGQAWNTRWGQHQSHTVLRMTRRRWIIQHRDCHCASCEQVDTHSLARKRTTSHKALDRT